ncbi:SIS domain-containing protein [Edaphobacter bradus]|uniref:SIS domain-containing protein n=1 Tax=Edaphobacter bradus TaxID=2259016 RepID=UPI0021E087A0|nr:SIS domain-containing protein [Edaphobacter bradus]
MIDTLEALLNATEEEKEARGTRYTPHEINQQPASWRRTLQIFEERQSELRSFLSDSGLDLRKLSRNLTVFLVGAGTSDYVGRALTYLLRRKWGCEVWAVPSTDLLTNLKDFVHSGHRYLWISFSRSGNSSEGLAVLEEAIEEHPQIQHLLVTCNEKSRMAKVCAEIPGRAFVVALDEGVNDRGLAMTSSYTNMVVAGQCLAHLGSLSQYRKSLSLLSETGELFLKAIQKTAPLIVEQEFSKACFVGSGVLHAVAQESALKLLELTAGKIQTMSESTLGLRHGPMSALDENTLLVSFLSQDRRRRKYEMDLLTEIHRKGLAKLRVVVSPDFADDFGPLADYAFCLDSADLHDEYRAPLDVMLAQSLGLFSSLKLGLQPDCPSPNGAISRVVEHVNIYR